MDPLSHGILGATFASLFNRKPQYAGYAALVGAAAGMAPDLDILIRNASDPMLGLGFHRHFTHALAFVPFGAAIVAGVFYPFLKKTFNAGSLYLIAAAGMVTHGILDSLTNYGTHLFWPFTERRESWNLISIIDPIFTITLALLLATTIYLKDKRYVMFGVLFALLYWAFGYYQREQATDALMKTAAQRGHAIERTEVKPGFGNLFIWRGQYIHDGVIQVDAYHVSPWRGLVLYEGGSIPLYAGPVGVSAVQMQDFEYFKFFSDGWLAVPQRNPEIVADMRFALLPNSLDPLWGIRFRPEAPDAHVYFDHVRHQRERDFETLWAMIRGAPLGVQAK